MLETLSILPMATGTRSRREVLHRAVPLLPKQKQHQQPLEQRPSQRPRPKQQAPRHPPQPPQQPISLPQQLPRQVSHSPFSIATPTRSIQNILNHASSMRNKRTINQSKDTDTADAADCEPVARKRPRLAVENLTRPTAATATADAKISSPTTALPPPKKSLRSALSPAAATAATATTGAHASSTATPSRPATHTQTIPDNNDDSQYNSQPHRTSRPPSKNTSQLAANSREKAANGIRQELKGLQVSPAAAAAAAIATGGGHPEGGRKLRSQEASRFKSELSAYFPDYDEIIGNEPKEEHLLNIDTPILLIESAANAATATTPAAATAATLADLDRASSSVRGYGDALFLDLFDSHVVDFGFLGNQYKGKRADDPLPDTYFEPHHKRAERLERSIRNSEKGRAQHEKDQIIRLLEGLQGPDWLRTMGVSGITESKKRAFEPARMHFIRGCRTILEKFRLWSAEEKRRKLEKDRAHAEEVRAREEAEGITRPRGRGKGKGKARRAVAELSGPPGGKKRRGRVSDDVDAVAEAGDTEAQSAAADENVELDDGISQADSSDTDAVIAKQLREEAALARSRVVSVMATATGGSKKRRTAPRSSPSSADGQNLSVPKEPAPQKEVTSFFQKPYQREAALRRNRRKGRNVLAWGQPVPEPLEADFDLPGELLDEELTTGHALRRRRETRGVRK